jgi:dTDP-4-amino-4,6-dideoxygalactose transaminase
MKNIPLFKVYISPSVADPLLKTLYSGYTTQGPRVEEFEYELRRWLDVKNILTVNSGTSALQLALTLSGAKYGTTIISTPCTCSATNTSIRAVGADIVWADINPLTGNIDSNSVEDRLKTNKDIKAVIMVHWGGYPCDIDEINFLGQKYNVKIIEDAAHAFGAEYKNLKIGNHSDFVCFSFQAIKHLTTADGGAVICKNDDDHKRGKLLRWFGIDRESPRRDQRCEEDITEAGFKYHMNDINATIGLMNLRDIDKIVKTHQLNGTTYDNELKEIEKLTLVQKHTDRLSSYWIYTVLVNDRDNFVNKMRTAGIGASMVHSRNDLFTMFKAYKTNLPGTDSFFDKQINIPSGWWVTDEDRRYIVDVIKKGGW